MTHSKNRLKVARLIAKVILQVITCEDPHLRYIANLKFNKLVTAKLVDLDGERIINAATEWFQLK